MEFKIIKKGSANFWHVFNNGGKEVNISDFEAVLDSVAQTFNVQLLNGANIPNTSVAIADIIVIDETDLSIEETFATVELLRLRLVELGYNPYLGAGNADSITGLITEGTNVTITGLGNLASPFIISSTGGSGVQTVTGTTVDNTDPLNPIVNVSTLQQVTAGINKNLIDGKNFQGTGAGDGSAASQINAFGTGSGANSSNVNINAFGEESANSNSGSNVNALGYQSGVSNSGANVNALGEQSANINSGSDLNAFGKYAGLLNTEINVNAFGNSAGTSNAFKNVNLFGFNASADAENQTVFSKWISGITNYLGRLSFNNITADRKWELLDESGDLPTAVLKSSSFTAVNSANYTATATLTVTDPTPITGKGFQVHVIGGTSTIGGVGYTAGALVYRYYDGAVWISTDMNAGGSAVWGGITGTLSNQTDLQSAFNNLFTKNILKDNYFWYSPYGITVNNGFAHSPIGSNQAFVLSGNANGAKGMALFASTAVAGTIAFKRRQDALILTGFISELTQKIQFQTNISGQRFFHGLTKNNQFTAPTNVDQTTLTNIVGVCQLSTSTNMHVIHNDASGTATTIDLGANYPCNDPQYNYYIKIEQLASSYIVTVERVTVVTGASISTSNTLSTNIMDYTTGVIQICTWITNNATASIASYLDGGGIGKFNN